VYFVRLRKMWLEDQLKECFECGEISDLHDHHVVPRSRGGTKTVPLCEECHSKAHHRKKNMNTSTLTRAALQRLKEAGVKLGNPNIEEVGKLGRAKHAEKARGFNSNIVNELERLEKAGVSTNAEFAECLNRKGLKTSRGQVWTAPNVARVRRAVMEKCG
jgi:hypothetical protein